MSIPFCIKEVDLNLDIHEIVSGPHDICTDCEPLDSTSALSNFFEIPVENERFFISVGQDNLASFSNRIINNNQVNYFKGKVFLGSKTSNSPWNFYLDPYSIELASFVDIDPHFLDLKPSLIESKLISKEIPEGQILYFGLSENSKQTNISEINFCQNPLVWDSIASYDIETGEMVQRGFCKGECNNIVYDYENEFGYCNDTVPLDIDAYIEELYKNYPGLEHKLSDLNDLRYMYIDTESEDLSVEMLMDQINRVKNLEKALEKDTSPLVIEGLL